MFQKYSIFIFILLFIASCKQVEDQFSNTPQLSIISVNQVKLDGRDSIVNITLGYRDGDGDLGLNQEDTMPPYNFPTKYFNNLLISVYRVDNGTSSRVLIPTFPPAVPDTINFNDRILNLTPTGKSKSISGEIQLFIKSLPYPGVAPDSMFYTFQLIDRALNGSNVVKTEVLKFQF